MQAQISGMQEKKPAALTEEAIESYLQSVASQGRTKGTLANYRRSLFKVFPVAPRGKAPFPRNGRGLSGPHDRRPPLHAEFHQYEPNAHQRHFGVYGAVELPGPNGFFGESRVPAEISRSEYLRLLSAAKQTNKEKVYLLIKVFATIGIQVQELPHVTVEAVRDGKVVTYPNRVRQVLRISPYVREELLQYIEKEGIATGQVFLTRAGRPISRTMVTTIIQNLSRDARVPEEKCNPRCLRKLYMKTMDTIQMNAAMMVQMTYDHLLEQEQSTYGWEDVKSHV